MKTIFVDDELLMMQMFEAECNNIPDIQIVGSFDDSLQALEWAKKNKVELAFLDIGMPKMDGVTLAEKLKELYPELIVIFVSAYDYRKKVFDDRIADYYISKPYQRDDVISVIERAKLLSGRQRKRVQIHTFGNFSVEVDGVPVQFMSGYAKALLAILVDNRGLPVSAQDAYYLIWEDEYYDRAKAAVYHNALHRLRVTLEDAGVPDLIQTMPRAIALNRSLADCDYYKLLEGDETTMLSFTGEYMTEWSWGEKTLSNLLQLQEEYRRKTAQK